jgi:hypothetical protein
MIFRHVCTVSSLPKPVQVVRVRPQDSRGHLGSGGYHFADPPPTGLTAVPHWQSCSDQSEILLVRALRVPGPGPSRERGTSSYSCAPELLGSDPTSTGRGPPVRRSRERSLRFSPQPGLTGRLPVTVSCQCGAAGTSPGLASDPTLASDQY